MKVLLAILLPLLYVWAACYVGGEVLPDGWADLLAPRFWWTFPAYITFGCLGLLSMVPLMITTGRTGYDEYL